MKHELKIEQRFLDALLDGSKTFEVRNNDRDYQKGDVLQFHSEALCDTKNYPCGGDVEFEVTYVHSGLGLQQNYVVLAVRKVTG